MLPLLLALSAGFPPPAVPAGWGVNVHFTDESPGEGAKIGAAFRWVRMDFAWSATEREPGRYDFAAYDRLLASLDRAKVRPIFILDYGNDLYEKGAPRSPEARAAFCRWVAAALTRFQGHGVVWEMWNEPNGGFWLPKADVEEYVVLAREVGETIRRIAPKEACVGPATSGFDWPFLQRCFDAGLLKYWDAVTVHPYRQNEPESVEADWLRLRGMIDRAAPRRNVPMISGEWGYSELYQGQTRARQADYAVRQYLVNLSCGVPISIWYDWKDDGTDPKETEHHFGTVATDLAPKAAYAAMAKLSRELAGFSYVTRIHTADGRQWLILLRKANVAKLVAWTTGEPSSARLLKRTIPLDQRPAVVAGADLTPLLAWRPMPWSMTIDTLADAEQAVAGQAVASIAAGELMEEPVGYAQGLLKAPTGTLVQQTRFIVRRPIRFTVLPGRERGFFARLENPYGRDLAGATYVIRGKAQPARPGDTPLPEEARFVDLHLGVNVVRRMTYRVAPLDLSDAAATADGDPKVRAVVSATPTADGTRLAYDFDKGWRFAELHPADPAIAGKPTSYGVWIEGDGSGNALRMRFVDASGQAFQPSYGPIDWKGWRYIAFPLDGSSFYWGGANDGVVHYPIRIGTLALVDMAGAQGGTGAITVARPLVMYGG